MEDTIVAQEETPIGPASSVLSPEKREEYRERARAELEVQEEMKAVKTEVHRAKMRKVTDARLERKAMGLAKRELAQLAMIRRMTPAKREDFKDRCNFFTPAMLALLKELDQTSAAAEVAEYQPLVGQASTEELRAELVRRGSLIGGLAPQDSASELDIDPAMQERVPEEIEEEDDNALSDTPETSTAEPVPIEPVINTEKKRPGRPPKSTDQK